MSLLNEWLDNWKSELSEIGNIDSLEKYRLKYLGKSGELTQALKNLGKLSVEEKKEQGAKLNAVRNEMNAAITSLKDRFELEALNAKMASEKIDITLPIRPQPEGHYHLLMQVMEDIKCYFFDRGFELFDGPDIDTEEFNFDALNIPAHHPARQSHDTFYLETGNQLLRTHTTNVEVRALRGNKPPMRALSCGRVYRSDDIDATHTPMFHQLEGIVVDKNINFGHLKSTLIEFCRDFFEMRDLPVRFRPSFFPFTEPSAEVDIGCTRVGNELKIGAGEGWMEILGCGMLHPNVLKNCQIDPEEFQGFAFGIGIERLTMLKYGIADIRNFFESDIRFLSHFGAKA